MADLEMQTMALSQIRPYPNNPRANDGAVAAVMESIKQCEYIAPIIVDEGGVILAGHTRYKALRALGRESAQVVIKAGLTDDQKRKYRLLDNKTGEFAEWDLERLESELEGLEFGGFDFGFPDFSQMEDADPATGGASDDGFDLGEDELPEPRARRGEIYLLGRHKVMCGDATDASDVAALMGDALADLCVTDPPYGTNNEEKEKRIQARKNRDGKAPNNRVDNGGLTMIAGDTLQGQAYTDFLTAAFLNIKDRLKLGGAFYIWHAWGTMVENAVALDAAGLKVRQQLVWAKSHFSIGMQDYQWMHELCHYGWKDGASHYFRDTRGETTVFSDEMPDIDKMKKADMQKLLKAIYADAETRGTVLREKKPFRNALHPTMKPIPLIARQICNSSQPRGIVLDLFGGSGTTLIACEQLERQCYTMELEPRYVDVIIGRWEQDTGRKAELVAG